MLIRLRSPPPYPAADNLPRISRCVLLVLGPHAPAARDLSCVEAALRGEHGVHLGPYRMGGPGAVTAFAGLSNILMHHDRCALLPTLETLRRVSGASAAQAMDPMTDIRGTSAQRGRRWCSRSWNSSLPTSGHTDQPSGVNGVICTCNCHCCYRSRGTGAPRRDHRS